MDANGYRTTFRDPDGQLYTHGEVQEIITRYERCDRICRYLSMGCSVAFTVVAIGLMLAIDSIERYGAACICILVCIMAAAVFGWNARD